MEDSCTLSGSASTVVHRLCVCVKPMYSPPVSLLFFHFLYIKEEFTLEAAGFVEEGDAAQEDNPHFLGGVPPL